MKNARLEKIIELINEQVVETQEELRDLLNDAGFPVTQATVSRDIKKLNLVKIPVAKEDENLAKQKYAVHEKKREEVDEKYARVLRDGFVSMDMAQNILVIKTVSGMAMAVAAALDALQITQVVGCIAGDDTVMCAIRTIEDTKKVMEILREMLRAGE